MTASYVPEICPHCDEPQDPSQTDEHVATAHADLPPCNATLDNAHSGGTLHCTLRTPHPKGPYDGWHVSAPGPVGRTAWNDTAIGATPHSGLGTPDQP